MRGDVYRALASLFFFVVFCCCFFCFLFFLIIIIIILIMEFDYTQTNKQVQVMALRLERGGELGGDVAINRRCHATGRWLVDQRGAWKSWRNL